MKKTLIIILCSLFALAALVVTLYPLLSNTLAEKDRSIVETQYIETVQQLDTTQLERARNDAVAYNETLLTVSGKEFSREALRQAADSYRDLLNIRDDGLMGYVLIPKIQVELPIYHGTEDESLDRGIGHLLGSSLPVGGDGTHCVLTGHSGLAGQKMFSDLEKMENGDVFFLNILDETLAYRVCEINTVLPEDTSKLNIDPKRDLCTLVTCTPYSINSHRLLVTGERCAYEPDEMEDAETASEPIRTGSTWTEAYLRGIALGLMGVILIILLALGVRAIRRHNREKST